jgi:hypothetical protein
VLTMPFRAITSDRVCWSQPSDRSPRTAWQAGAIDALVQICAGGAWAKARFEQKTSATKRREENAFHRQLIWLPPILLGQDSTLLDPGLANRSLIMKNNFLDLANYFPVVLTRGILIQVAEIALESSAEIPTPRRNFQISLLFSLLAGNFRLEHGSAKTASTANSTILQH